MLSLSIVIPEMFYRGYGLLFYYFTVAGVAPPARQNPMGVSQQLFCGSKIIYVSAVADFYDVDFYGCVIDCVDYSIIALSDAV